jgi:hypothetical protein
MKEAVATTIGFLVAPLVPALALGLVTPLDSTGPDARVVLGLLPIGYLISLVAMTLLGMPMFLIGRWLHFIRWWSSAAAGFAIGLLMDVLIRLPYLDYFSSSPIGKVAYSFLNMGAIGTLTGFLFWLIWRLGDTFAEHQ